MKSILVALTCKQCMYTTHKKSETLIMPDFEPELRDALLAGSFFKKACPCCGSMIEFIHPLLYVDKAHDFLIMIKPSKDGKDDVEEILKTKIHSKKRYLYGIDGVGEKIKILESSMDDRAIEIIKVKLLLRGKQRQQDIQSIYYHDMDLQSKTIWFEVQQDGMQDALAITMESYEGIKKHLPKEDTTRFQEINKVWAIGYMK